MMIKMDDEKLWTELLAHQEANIEERPEVVMLQLSGDYLFISLLFNHIFPSLIQGGFFTGTPLKVLSTEKLI